MSLFLSVCLSIRPSVSRAPYLRNHTSSNHNFWYTHVKWWYLQGFFHCFENLIFWAVRGVKGQKIAQNEKWKLHTSGAISQEQYSLWSWVLVHLCKIMISPGFFFFIFDIFICPAVRGVNGQKTVQDDKKFCLLHFISQKPYIIWSWFMVHMYKRIGYISGCFSHFFQILIFGVNSGAKEQKMAQNDRKFSLTLYLRNCTSYDCVFGTHV